MRINDRIIIWCMLLVCMLSLTSCKILDVTGRGDEQFDETIIVETAANGTADIPEERTYYYYTSDNGQDYARYAYSTGDDNSDSETHVLEVTPQMLLAQLADTMQVEFEIASDIEVQKNTITVVFSTYDWKDKRRRRFLAVSKRRCSIISNRTIRISSVPYLRMQMEMCCSKTFNLNLYFKFPVYKSFQDVLHGRSCLPLQGRGWLKLP